MSEHDEQKSNTEGEDKASTGQEPLGEASDALNEAGKAAKDAGESAKEAAKTAKEAAEAAKEAAKEAGKAAKEAGKEVGKEAKKAIKEVAKEAKNAGKEAQEAGKEAGEAAKGAGKAATAAAKQVKKGMGGGRSIPKIILGLLIVLVGLVIFLEEMNVDADYLWRVLPLMVIFIGVAKVLGASAHSQRFMGGLLIFTGVIWLSGAWALWPLAIILFGLYVVWRALGGRRGVPHSGRGVTHSDYIRDFVIFGSSERRIESRNFQGGDLTAVFGGVDLDLRSCPPPDGEAPVLELFVLFGGIDIRIPETWVVSQEATALFGGIEDSTHSPMGGSLDAASPPRLVLKGVALFGGIDIKN